MLPQLYSVIKDLNTLPIKDFAAKYNITEDTTNSSLIRNTVINNLPPDKKEILLSYCDFINTVLKHK